VRGLWWTGWGVEAAAVVLVLIFAPVVALVAFATGDSKTGWTAVAALGGALLYGLLLGWDFARNRPKAREQRRARTR
jgi:hypothetical protein